MKRTLQRLVRLRRLDEDVARTAFLEGQAALAACRQRVADVEADVADQQQAVAADADDLSRTHAYVLRQEMLRRRLEAQADRLQGEVARRRDALVEASKTTKVTEKLLEAEERRAQAEAQMRWARELDEVGQIGWARRRSA